MVKIPAGTLRPLYGASVKVGAFRIDRDPVTRGEYYHKPVSNPRAPMTDGTWAEARSYCLARGARLPTLAEWEYVAALDSASRDRVVASYEKPARHMKEYA